jgi:hypothetical protein
MNFRILLISAFLGALFFFVVTPVSAHGRTPRLEISAERMNPGAVLDIRGVEFDYEELVALYLERQGIVVSLGQINANLEGIFIHTIVLPSDLPSGEYSIRGVTEHHDVLSPVFSVQGPAVAVEGGGQGERDDDDGLLAPMPTSAPGVVPGAVTQPAVQPAFEQPPGSSRRPVLLVLLGSVAVGILIAARLRRVARR